MIRRYKPYIPKTLDEVMDQLGFMMMKSPTFEDPVFPGRSIETAFLQLNEGLGAIRKELGEERFRVLAALSDRVRAHFESDPKDENGGAREGRRLIREMEQILEAV